MPLKICPAHMPVHGSWFCSGFLIYSHRLPSTLPGPDSYSSKGLCYLGEGTQRTLPIFKDLHGCTACHSLTPS